MKKLTYRSTMFACYNGYITQAICINFAPLLFLTFQREYSLSITQISVLIAVCFAVQLTVDLLSSVFADRLNVRAFTVLAHVVSGLGLMGLSLLPEWLPPFAGLLLSVVMLGIGGGFTEVMISPLMEACPTEKKSENMSLLHSFYCWGQAGVILLSSLFFYFFPLEKYWRVLPFLWAIIPLFGAVLFTVVPIYLLEPAGKESGESKSLFSRPLFWVFLLMMFCGGASELIMGQWASSFAESALGVSKEAGDLLGPCLFALMMGLTRAVVGKAGGKLPVERVMIGCCVLCVTAYLLAAFSPFAWMSLAGCALCGISVGIFWPGTLSRASAGIPEGGIAMFALLALAGDLGCLLGPSAAGIVADLFGGNLRAAFCFAVIFPLMDLAVLLVQERKRKNRKNGDTENK